MKGNSFSYELFRLKNRGKMLTGTLFWPGLLAGQPTNIMPFAIFSRFNNLCSDLGLIRLSKE